MQDILNNPPEFVGAPTTSAAIPKGETRAKNEAQDLKFYAQLDDTQTAKVVNGEDLPPTIPPRDAAAALNQDIASGKSLEEIQKNQENITKVNETLSSVKDYSAVTHALAKDPNVSAEVVKIQSRFDYAKNRLSDVLDTFDQSLKNTVLEILDGTAYFTIEDLINAPRALMGKGGAETKISELYLEAARTMTQEEFVQFVEDRLAGPATHGFADSESAIKLAREINALDKAGFVLFDKEWSFTNSLLVVGEAASVGVKTAKSVVGRLRATAGTETATEAAETALVRKEHGVNGEVLDPAPKVEGPTPKPSKIKPDVTEAEIIDESIPGVYGSKIDTPPVSFGKLDRTLGENQFIKEFMNLESKNAFGGVDISKVSDAWVNTLRNRFSERTARPTIDVRIDFEGMGNYKASAIFGKADGSTYKTHAAARKAAKKIEGAKVIDLRTNRIAKEDTKSGQYGVFVEERLNLRKAFPELNLDEVKGGEVIRKWFGRASGGSSSFFSNLADAADFGPQGFRARFKGYDKVYSKLSKDEMKALDRTLEVLRDGEKADIRNWIDPVEFARLYEQTTGQKITKKVLSAYESAIEQSNFAWWIDSSRKLQDVAHHRGLVLDIEGSGIIYPTRRSLETIKTEEPGAFVYDVAADKLVSIRSLDDKARVRILAGNNAKGTKYVVNWEDASRLPTHSDVLGYNPGGFRTNPDIRFFVGGTQEGSWKSVFGARTEQQAKAGAKEYNTIMDKAEVLMKADGVDKITDLTPLSKAELEAAILKNNEWNPHLETVDDLDKFMDARGLKVEKVNWRERDHRMSLKDVLDDPTMVDVPLHQYAQFSRQNEVLLEYGGKRARNPDPLQSIMHRFHGAISKGPQNYYRTGHVTAWAKALRKAIDEHSLKIDGIPRDASDEALVQHAVINGKSSVAEKLRMEQSVIKRRLKLYDGNIVGNKIDEAAIKVQAAIEDRPIVHTVDKWVLDKFKIDNAASNAVRGTKEFVIDKMSGNLMNLGFIERMASPDQALLQAVHGINIGLMSAGGGSANGFKGALLATILKQAAVVTEETLGKELARRMAKFAGISEDEFQLLLDHFRTSGRGFTKGTVADDPLAGDIGKGVIGKAKDFISIPYYAGENYSATASRITAFLDTRSRFPKLDPNSATFWHKVQARDRDLSMGLNSAQKSMLQEDSWTRVLGQWSSYSLGAIETVVFNKNLSKAERAALGLSFTAMYGAVGFGMYSTVASVLPDSWPDWVKTTILKGPLDLVLEEVGGVSMATRLAPLHGIMDRVVNTVSAPIDTTPAIGLAVNSTEAFYNTVRDVFSGKGKPIIERDVASLLRLLKVVDGPWMAYTMATQGARKVRTGKSIEADWTKTQIVMQALGFSPSQAVDKNLMGSLTWEVRKRVKEASLKATPLFRDAVDLARKGDYDGAATLFQEGDSILQAYNLGPVFYAEARNKAINSSMKKDIEMIILTLMKNGDIGLAAQLQKGIK